MVFIFFISDSIKRNFIEVIKTPYTIITIARFVLSPLFTYVILSIENKTQLSWENKLVLLLQALAVIFAFLMVVVADAQVAGILVIL